MGNAQKRFLGGAIACAVLAGAGVWLATSSSGSGPGDGDSIGWDLSGLFATSSGASSYAGYDAATAQLAGDGGVLGQSPGEQAHARAELQWTAGQLSLEDQARRRLSDCFDPSDRRELAVTLERDPVADIGATFRVARVEDVRDPTESAPSMTATGCLDRLIGMSMHASLDASALRGDQVDLLLSIP